MNTDLQQAPKSSRTSRRSVRPLLVTVGPTGGGSALTAARAIAAKESRDLVLVSVVTPPPVYTFETNRALLLPWLVEQQTAERREHVHELVRRLGMQSAHRKPAIEIAYGEPPEEITRLARECNACLIVMGIGPHEARGRLLSAGTVAAVSQHARCPVLAVGEHARIPARSAVVATDFSPESVYAARVARRLLDAGAVVDIVHAWHRLDAVSPSVAVATLNDSYVDSLTEQFDRVRRAIDSAGSVTVYPVALEGRPAEIVLGIARSKRVDLIVAATHGHGALHRLLLGSTSSALLRGADCSVLLVPAPPLAEQQSLERVAGDTTTTVPAQWNGDLQAFVRRNRNRPTKLEIDDPAIGAQVQQTGYALVGAAYDASDARLGLMFGGTRAAEPHLTHSLGAVRSISVHSDPGERDEALLIRSGEGSALLTFLPETVSRSSDIA